MRASLQNRHSLISSYGVSSDPEQRYDIIACRNLSLSGLRQRSQQISVENVLQLQSRWQRIRNGGIESGGERDWRLLRRDASATRAGDKPRCLDRITFIPLLPNWQPF